VIASVDTAARKPRTSVPPRDPARAEPAAETTAAAGTASPSTSDDALARLLSEAVAQRALAAPSPSAPGLLQRLVKTSPDSGSTLHVLWGDANVSDAAVPHDDVRADPPVLVEVMEYDVASAKGKVEKVAAVNKATNSQSRIAIVVALNEKAKSEHTATNGRLTGSPTLAAYGVKAKAKTVADEMDRQGVVGACFPAVWSPTDMTATIYTFPFLELRARTTQHAGTRDVRARLEEATAGRVVVRSMDADVSHDPLLEGRVTAGWLGSIADNYDAVVLSGGYEWDTTAPKDEFWGLKKGRGVAERIAKLNAKWTAIITLINAAEHVRRQELVLKSPSLLYWPEPNVYTSADLREQGAQNIMDTADFTKDSQMRESVYYLEDPASKRTLKAVYDPTMTTTKPVKAYFDWLKTLILTTPVPPLPKIVEAVQGVRQTHLSPKHIEDIQKWYGVKTPLDSIVKAQLEGTRLTQVTTLATNVRAELLK
jgi:hypothetical protein